MNMIRIMVISLAVGFVAAGFVWYGIEMIENLLARARRPQEKPQPEGGKEEVGVRVGPEEPKRTPGGRK